MNQQSMPFHKIHVVRTNHRNEFDFLAVLLHLVLLYCENAIELLGRFNNMYRPKVETRQFFIRPEFKIYL